MTDVKTELATLQSDTAAQKTVIDSALTFISGLQGQLATLLAAAKDQEDLTDFEAGVQALHDSIGANTQELATAIAGTPAPAGTTSPAAPIDPSPTPPVPNPTPSSDPTISGAGATATPGTPSAP